MESSSFFSLLTDFACLLYHASRRESPKPSASCHFASCSGIGPSFHVAFPQTCYSRALGMRNRTCYYRALESSSFLYLCSQIDPLRRRRHASEMENPPVSLLLHA
jgi:hypothetical protein